MAGRDDANLPAASRKLSSVSHNIEEMEMAYIFPRFSHETRKNAFLNPYALDQEFE